MNYQSFFASKLPFMMGQYLWVMLGNSERKARQQASWFATWELWKTSESCCVEVAWGVEVPYLLWSTCCCDAEAVEEYVTIHQGCSWQRSARNKPPTTSCGTVVASVMLKKQTSCEVVHKKKHQKNTADHSKTYILVGGLEHFLFFPLYMG